MTPTELRPTPPEIEALLQRLALPRGEQAQLLGVSPRAIQKWLAGASHIDAPVWRLLRLAAEVPAARAWLENGAPEDGRGRRS